MERSSKWKRGGGSVEGGDKNGEKEKRRLVLRLGN